MGFDADPLSWVDFRDRGRTAVLILVLFVCAGSVADRTDPAPDVRSRRGIHASESRRIAADYARLPLRFESNQGQADEQIKFISRGNGYAVFLTAHENILTLRSRAAGSAGSDPRGEAGRPTDRLPHRHPGAPHSRASVVRLKLEGANSDARMEGLEELPGKTNYYLGNDPRRWRTGVPSFARVRSADIYPGIDLIYYGNQRQLEYDFIVAPGADPTAIRFLVEGVKGVELNDAGDLALKTPAGVLIQRAPVIYQESDGARHPVSGRYVLTAGHRIGFQIGAYDPRKPLIIDPVVLSYSTFLGGSSPSQGLGEDQAFEIARDSEGNIYITGLTNSSDFPTANPVQPNQNGFGFDAFITKLNAAGDALIYSTYFGGGSSEVGEAIAVDASGNAYVTGATSSENFPVSQNAFQQALPSPGWSSAFVTKLSASGTLVYSTYLGGNASSFPDRGRDIGVDASGNAYVTGQTGSTNFPLAGAFQSTFGGPMAAGTDAFLTKLNATGTGLVYSTYVGGSGLDTGTGLAVDSSGEVYLTGYTGSVNFPTTGGTLRSSCAGSFGQDAFVMKFEASGAQLDYSTCLGGTRSENAHAVVADSSGNAYVTGGTFSGDFPTTVGAFDRTCGEDGNCEVGKIAFPDDAFVVKLNSTGTSLLYSTFLGGNNDDLALSLAVDNSGNAYVTGFTLSPDFPLVSPFQGVNYGNYDVFVTKVDPTGSSLAYSTFLGGAASDWGGGIVEDSGVVHVAGLTGSTDFPTVNPFQASKGTNLDAFVAKIEVTENNPAPAIVSLSTTTAQVGGAPSDVSLVV